MMTNEFQSNLSSGLRMLAAALVGFFIYTSATGEFNCWLMFVSAFALPTAFDWLLNVVLMVSATVLLMVGIGLYALTCLIYHFAKWWLLVVLRAKDEKTLANIETARQKVLAARGRLEAGFKSFVGVNIWTL